MKNGWMIFVVVFAASARGEDLRPVVPDLSPVKVAAAHSWRTRTDAPDEVYLYDGTTQVGGWSYAQRHYRPYAAASGTWGQAVTAAPVPPPARQAKGVSQPLPFGQGIGASVADQLNTGSRTSTATGRTRIGVMFAVPRGFTSGCRT